MLSAVIHKECSYPAMHLTVTTGTLGILSLRSSRTRSKFSQLSNADSG